MERETENTISEVTRRNIFDRFIVEKVAWSGRLDEPVFLLRVFDLEGLRSDDHRYSTAYQDIHQHRVRNRDWEDDWVFSDPRFDLLRGPDEVFLKFLCEVVHPVVRPDAEWVDWLVEVFNQNLTADGWEIAPCRELSGRPVFEASRLIEGASHALKQAHQQVAEVVDAGYVSQQVTRMKQAIKEDPELAIGTAKEFVETVCKTVLNDNSVGYSTTEDLSKLVKMTLRQLKLTPDDVSDSSKAAKTIRVLLSNLATVSKGLAELRNIHGSGHGKAAQSSGLGARHARLAVGAATTLGVFIFETHQQGETGL